MKRFDFSYAGKLSHYVAYPETLSLKTFIPESPQSLADPLRNMQYKLYGVLVHLGYTSHSGHYYSYVRGPSDQWYKADDQSISQVSQADAMAQNAYILFYTRVNQGQSVSATAASATTSTAACNGHHHAQVVVEPQQQKFTTKQPISNNNITNGNNIPMVIKSNGNAFATHVLKNGSNSTSSYLNSLLISKPVVVTPKVIGFFFKQQCYFQQKIFSNCPRIIFENK